MDGSRISRLNDFFKSNLGSYIASIIIAVGIVSILRKSCTGPNCSIVKAPDPDIVSDTVWKINGRCFKFDPNPIDCPEKNIIERFQNKLPR